MDDIRKVRSVKLYACGCCENELRHVFSGYPSEKRRFPALSVLITHERLGNILYDTGYSELIYENGLVSKIYNSLNRTYISKDETIISKLEADGISPDSVKKIIISHAHPDHIGALRLFGGYELISTPKVINTLYTGNCFDLVFRNMVPEKQPKLRALKKYNGKTIFDGYFKKTYDIFADGSVIGIELDGHADGQLGLFLPEYDLLFAADACWGEDLMPHAEKMRFIPKLIQHSYRQYLDSIKRLRAFSSEHPEIKIIFSHGAMQEKKYE